MYTKGFVATLASLLLIGTNLAEASPRAAAHVENMFRVSDANRDGVITQAEARVVSVRDFRKYDIDGDGLLSYAEIRKHQLEAGASQFSPDIQTKIIAAVFALYDVDGDGRITLENYHQSKMNLLLKADFDQDGQVTLQEARQLHGVVAP